MKNQGNNQDIRDLREKLCIDVKFHIFIFTPVDRQEGKNHVLKGKKSRFF